MPFRQIIRSTCLVFTVMIYRIRYGRHYATKTYLSLIPVVVGVGFTPYSDYYFSRAGLALTLLGIILFAVKVLLSSLYISFAHLASIDRCNKPYHDWSSSLVSLGSSAPDVAVGFRPNHALLLPRQGTLCICVYVNSCQLITHPSPIS